MEREFDVILLDVDGTLLDFAQSEREGMKVVLRSYGFKPTKARLALYREINKEAWAAFERGETTKEKLSCDRFVTFFGKLGKEVDGAEAEELYRAFGRAWTKFPEGWKLFLLSSHTEFERTFGKQAAKKRKLYNGMLKCDLYMYL